MPPTEIVADDSAIGMMCNDVFGEGWGSFRIAHLSTGDKIGVEILNFETPSSGKTTLNTGKPAYFTFVYPFFGSLYINTKI